MPPAGSTGLELFAYFLADTVDELLIHHSVEPDRLARRWAFDDVENATEKHHVEKELRGEEDFQRDFWDSRLHSTPHNQATVG